MLPLSAISEQVIMFKCDPFAYYRYRSHTELVLKQLLPNSLYKIDVCSKKGDETSAYSSPPLRITTFEAGTQSPSLLTSHLT